MKECDVYLQNKTKFIREPTMPRDLAARTQCCIVWMSHPSSKSDVGTGEGKQDAVYGLLGRQQTNSHHITWRDAHDERVQGDIQICAA